MVINFFWSGDAFDYLNYLTIKSHVNVGHDVIIHLHGNEPNSIYWNKILSLDIQIQNADDIISITSFMNKGANFRTASSLWRFTFLYKYGGYYSDCDAIAIKHWPSNTKWVLCSGDKDLISTGVIKTPPKEDMFIEMIKYLKLDWGNVQVFNHFYKKYKGNNNPNFKTRNFYPFTWEQWEQLLQNNPIPEYVYSVHLFNTMFYRNDKIQNLEQWVKTHPDTMLNRLDTLINE